MKNIQLCQFGCGVVANYQLKSGKFCCSKSPNSCLVNKNKNSKGLKDSYENGTRISQKIQYENLPDNIKENMKWNKGLTKDTDERVNLHANLMHEKYSTGELIPSFLNKKHSNETKQLLSQKACENNNGYVKTKYYPIFCPYINDFVKVQGTYELKYAEYLNENTIKWIRSKTINLKYKLHEEDYIHTYYPDFYLPDNSEYIEIKGWWWKSLDGRVDDKRKMRKVYEQNPDKIIKILEKNDLLILGIII